MIKRGGRSFGLRLLVASLALSLSLGLSACSGLISAGPDEAKVADYGTYGSDLALELAEKYPYRSAGSDIEAGARDFLASEFKALGFKTTTQKFTYSTADGQSVPSANLFVRIEGDGVERTDEPGAVKKERRQIIIGAHYDVRITAAQGEEARQAAAAAAAASETTADGQAEQESTASAFETPTLADFDGIHANASGIGVLFTLARQLKGQKLAHDIVLVAFGSGTADHAGAKAFVQGMGAADLARTDAMYNIDGIYAGDEVYVHAGQNSVLPGDRKNYELRRKLYEATDVFFENKLYTTNQYNLLTNQSSIRVPLGDTGEMAIYREWSLHRSDHTPFDEAGIPVVFFESYDYNHKSVDEMKESKNPTLAATDGQIRDTAFDSTDFLSYLLSNTAAAASASSAGAEKETIDRLTLRINNTAFVIQEAIKRSSAVTTAVTTTEE